MNDEMIMVTGEDFNLHVKPPNATDSEWYVWLNPDDSEDAGLCVGSGATRNIAIADAKLSLERIIASLSSGKAVTA